MNAYVFRPKYLSSQSAVRIAFVAITIGAVLGVTMILDGRPATPHHLLATIPLPLLGLALLCRGRSHKGSTTKDRSTLRTLRLHPELLVACHAIRHSLCDLARQSDEILRDVAAVRLAAIQEEVRTLASGRIVFADTEAWRTAYERVLRTPGLGRYYSVAWLRSEDYWRDAPGRHSMQLNYDLLQLGVSIERTLILNDFFWPPAATLPAKVISQWIEEQFKRGIVMRLVRESEIESERELLADFGIYGHRATGQLELDDQCRAIRFTLDFTPQALRVSEDRWRRLQLFAVSFRELLDRKARGA